MVEENRMAYFPDALGILDNLKEPPQYIQATGNSIMVSITLEGLNDLKGYTVVGLLDSGATTRFMSQRFVDKHGIEVEPLPSCGGSGLQRRWFPEQGRTHHPHCVPASVNARPCRNILVCSNGYHVIIGFNWLKQHNPEIDWQKQTIRFSRCPATCKRACLWEEWEEEDNASVKEGDCIFITKMYPEDILDEQDAEHLCAMGSVATKLAATAHEAKGAKTLEESVPTHYLEEF
jgi:hypothetical protein